MYGRFCRYVPVFRELFSRAMQEPDMRIGALDHLAVHFQHKAQHAVRRRMLGAKIHGVVSNFSHGNSPMNFGVG
jgi:hypothetical protein